MIRLVLVMAPLVFVLNGVLRHDWPGAFFFALAVAVGLTPEMLPMVFSVCLSQGAVAMARRRVIVKPLDAIQGVGAIDVLCTDKTGPLTRDAIILERHCDVQGTERAAVEGTAVFARLTPGHKERIIRALQARGHVVGFLGDGINDAPALHTADVGISVDSAVDIAKDAADVILLDQDLRVLEDGVRQGRTTFANIRKYVRMGASSNFGNMLSVVGASARLPVLPMAPIQVLTNSLLYDVSQLPIPGDRVDPDQLAKPRPWSLPALRRYILVFGPLSSLFDYATFAALFFLFGFDTPARRAAFQTGWFVESLCTQALVIHVIRTERIPFLQSRPSAGVLAASVAVVATGVWLPMSPLAASLGFVPLPRGYWPLLAAVVLGYLGLTQVAKGWLRRRGLV